MRSRSITMILVLTLSLFFPVIPLKAQTMSSDWSRLTSAESGNKLVVKLKTGKSLEGTLNSVSDSSLTLKLKNSTQELKREDIQSVHRVTRKSAGKATLIGAGVGAGAGALVGAVGGGNDSSFDKLDQAVTAGLTIIGAGVGAVGGYLIGRSGRKRELIYEAR
jgi:small nuclear ribonucleoprotein (snRNP)-like protein